MDQVKKSLLLHRLGNDMDLSVIGNNCTSNFRVNWMLLLFPNPNPNPNPKVRLYYLCFFAVREYCLMLLCTKAESFKTKAVGYNANSSHEQLTVALVCHCGIYMPALSNIPLFLQCKFCHAFVTVFLLLRHRKTKMVQV